MLLNIKRSFIIIGLLFLGFFKAVYAATDEQAAINNESATPPNMGNFALPPPQQPGPLFSFGQTIIGRNILQLNYNSYTNSPSIAGESGKNAGFIFGFTDATSVYFNYPAESNYINSRRTHITSFVDPFLQLEHAFYTKGNSSYQDQATVIGLITLPVRDVNKLTSRETHYLSTTTINSNPDYFLGLTFNRTSVNWEGFVSPGIFLTSANDHFKLGSQFLYEAGIGHNIISVSDRFILFGLLEFEGQYTEKDSDFGISIPDTGGTIISLAPSLWFSTRHLILQAGISLPVVQQLYGDQTKLDYSFIGSISWTIG